MKTERDFPNGFTSWIETHYEVVTTISMFIDNDVESDVLETVLSTEGTGGLYHLAEDLTDEFERKNLDREWDGEFFDEIIDFIKSKLMK